MLKEKQEQSDAQFKKEKEEVRSWPKRLAFQVEGRTDGTFEVKLVEFPWRRYRSMEMIFLNHMFLFTLLGPISGKYHDYDGKAIFSIF